MTEKINEESYNDTLIIVSIADSTLVSFTYSQNQSDLEKIQGQSKKLTEYAQIKTKKDDQGPSVS